MKKVLLVHGFNGIPKIFYYFQEELIKNGYDVIIPNFPTQENITVDKFFEVFDNYRNDFNEDLIVIAHSIGNPMIVKYLSNNNLTVGMYISLAGFSKSFFNEGKDILNEKVKLTVLSDKEKENIKKLTLKRFSIYSNDDHIVPLDILESFCTDIDSKPVLIENIGHMGKKSGLEKLPKVIEIIKKEG